MGIRRKRVIVAAAVIAVCAIFAVAALLALLTDPDRYRSQVISYLETKTGKQIEIGHIGVNWNPLSIRLDNVGVRTPKPFPPGYFLKAARVEAALDPGALLHRQIVIKSIVVRDPIINVISDPDGLWNFENPASNTSRKRAPVFALGLIPRVEITGGQLSASSLIDPTDRPGPVVFEARDMAATLEQVDFDAFLDSASTVVAQGDMHAGSLRFGSIEATNVKCKLRLQARQISFSDIKANTYGGSTAGSLSFTLGKNTIFNAFARLGGIDMSRLLASFRSARGKMTGIMEGDVKLAGAIEHTLHPLAGMHGAGHVTVRNGQVPSLKLNENLMKLAHFNDLGPAKQDPSSFSSISTDLELANQRISSGAVEIEGYGVNVSGSGSVSVSGSDDLNYQGVASIVAKQGFFTNLEARLSGASSHNGRLSFPFRVRGTVENPTFSMGNKADQDRQDAALR